MRRWKSKPRRLRKEDKERMLASMKGMGKKISYQEKWIVGLAQVGLDEAKVAAW